MQKVSWKNEPLAYRQIEDGFSWFCYCMNSKCVVYKQLVVLPRGYAVVSLQKEVRTAVCPVCKMGNRETAECQLLKFKNCGFVNCQWAIRGTLKKNQTSKIHTDGRTYDSKLYTF